MYKIATLGLLLLPLSMLYSQHTLSNMVWPRCTIYFNNSSIAIEYVGNLCWSYQEPPGQNIYKDIFVHRGPPSLVALCARKMSHDAIAQQNSGELFDNFIAHQILALKPQVWISEVVHGSAYRLVGCQLDEQQVYSVIQKMGQYLGDKVIENIELYDENFLKRSDADQQKERIQQFYAISILKMYENAKDNQAFVKFFQMLAN